MAVHSRHTFAGVQQNEETIAVVEMGYCLIAVVVSRAETEHVPLTVATCRRVVACILMQLSPPQQPIANTSFIDRLIASFPPPAHESRHKCESIKYSRLEIGHWIVRIE